MSVRYHCQDCGRPANFKAFARRKKISGDPDHDLCSRCWVKRLGAAKAEQIVEDAVNVLDYGE